MIPLRHQDTSAVSTKSQQCPTKTAHPLKNVLCLRCKIAQKSQLFTEAEITTAAFGILCLLILLLYPRTLDLSTTLEHQIGPLLLRAQHRVVGAVNCKEPVCPESSLRVISFARIGVTGTKTYDAVTANDMELGVFSKIGGASCQYGARGLSKRTLIVNARWLGGKVAVRMVYTTGQRLRLSSASVPISACPPWILLQVSAAAPTRLPPADRCAGGIYQTDPCRKIHTRIFASKMRNALEE